MCARCCANDDKPLKRLDSPNKAVLCLLTPVVLVGVPPLPLNGVQGSGRTGRNRTQVGLNFIYMYILTNNV